MNDTTARAAGDFPACTHCGRDHSDWTDAGWNTVARTTDGKCVMLRFCSHGCLKQYTAGIAPRAHRRTPQAG